jgi:hypothetical protein
VTTIRPRQLVLLALMVLVCASAVRLQGQSAADDPAPVIRSLVMAIYGNDVASYNEITLPHPLRSRLTTGGRVNESMLRQLKENPAGLQIKARRPLLFEGREAKIGANRQYPAGTTGLYLVAHGSGPMLVGVVRRPEGWRVDLRWWIAMTDLAAGVQAKRDTPEFAIRSLLMALLQRDRRAAGRLITDVRGALDTVFAGAPSQREPSGVLDATAMEMPLVEIGPGEFAVTPTGRIVEGLQAADRKILVGWFGPIEMPFVMRRAGSSWRIEPEPYLAAMNQ